MSLIKFEDYTGSIVGQAVEEALEMIGIINKLNINGYTLDITGVQESTPKGMIEDTPKKHVITFERSMFVKNMSKKEFNNILGNSEETAKILNQQECADINFSSSNGAKIDRKISRDDAGYVWYNHKVRFQVDQLVVETPENYVKRLFETIANYVIQAFETVQ